MYSVAERNCYQDHSGYVRAGASWRRPVRLTRSSSNYLKVWFDRPAAHPVEGRPEPGSCRRWKANLLAVVRIGRPGRIRAGTMSRIGCDSLGDRHESSNTPDKLRSLQRALSTFETRQMQKAPPLG